jgi:hypothetical protein
VDISSKNGAISISIALMDAHTKADARVPITARCGRASAEAMTGILM